MKKSFGTAVQVPFGSTVGNGQGHSESGWIVKADTINPANYYGVTVANGMIGLVSSSSDPLKMKDIVLNGVYDSYGRGRVSNILKGFNFAGTELEIDGIYIGRENISNMRQVLDMKRASFSNLFDFGNKASVVYTVRSLRQLPFTSLIEVKVKARQDLELAAASVIETPDILRDARNFYAEIDRPHVNIPLLTSTATSPGGKHEIAVSNSFIFGDEHHPDVIHEDYDHNRHLARFRKPLKRGETYRFSVVATETSTAHFKDPRNEPEPLTVYATLEGRDKLVRNHNKAWKKLWKSDIKIEGNVKDQREIRLALYHLYSFAREGTAYSLSPMGLSGLGYNGHVFWDTEIWMYPPLLMLQPQIAKSLLEYRYERLEAARQKAFAHGFDGAMYPWESDDSGQEATPAWSLCGPFEHHITAVVGIAFWNYYRVTGDKDWLREKGYPVLKEVADFWVSRVEKDKNGNCNINNVVGADEWAENIDNNAFTNGAATTALRFAVSAAEALGEKPDIRWAEVANNIPVLKLENGVTSEHATYQGEAIKQADVNLLAYPLDIISEPEQVQKDVEYYESRIGQGPAMSHSVLSVLHSRLGNPEKAYQLFKQSYKPNEVPPFGVIAETAGGTNPYFATGAGGMLQSVLAGFAGLHITNDGIIQLDPPLPPGWQSIEVTGVGREKKKFINSVRRAVEN